MTSRNNRYLRERKTGKRPDVGKNKVISYQRLKEINESSVRMERNRNVYFEKLPIKDDGTIYVTGMTFIHNDCEVRSMIILNTEPGGTCVLDMSFAEWESLPTVDALLAKRDELESVANA